MAPTLRISTDKPPETLPALVEPGPELSREEVERYSRHLIIPEIGMQGQRRLKNARVLVIGAGGLGSPALLYLAAAGVGTIGIVDDDVVDLSNLQRQVIHAVADVGRPKLESARESILALNPLVNVVLHPLRLDAANALEVFAGYDLVLDGADNFATRYLVNDAVALQGKPYVWGSILRFDGQVSVFWEQHGPTYRDLYPEPPAAGTVPSCGEGGVFGMLCAAVGSLMVIEAVKLITGVGRTLLGRLMIFDALASSWREIRISKDPEAQAVTGLMDYEAFCGLPATPAVSGDAEGMPGNAAGGAGGAGHRAADVITARELADRLVARDRGDDRFELIDVREQGEFDIVRIPGSRLIPLSGIQSGNAFAGIDHGVPLVLHCKVGGRSAQALASLKAAGYDDVVHLEGGILAWVNEVEPEKPVY
ncbi:molybdopterin-synthase adenylyltransferase MoeB [Paenarthrobacter sp. Z7-10]|uniref:molybdopterin-synthase adenylyltransferase MoeB n=1 Tax=Paenarthrobacter sp. Z7-10 TaxID=2787635 RepID=UPI0022A9F290|nr:molybdopterin-synthase adenylyltransferase MoeB [Paenarthrobacter sp. Z7-10]MCZ2403221.1 molybdopterin-synthase adenylyltransferase MoeB [Paenarthrobacter sp. Z7-10]